MKKEKINVDDFKINELRITCSGGTRTPVIKNINVNYEIKNRTLKLSFALPKGSYATALLEQIGL